MLGFIVALSFLFGNAMAGYVPSATWFVDVNMHAGSMSGLGITARSDLTDIANSTLVLSTPAPGSATVWISCATTVDASGANCGANPEDIGISVTLPVANQHYEVCFDFQAQYGGTSGNASITFEVVKTGNTNQTVLLHGGSRIGMYSSSDNSFPFHLCGIFFEPLATRVTYRLMFEQGAQSTEIAIVDDANAARADRDTRVTVRKWP